MPSSATPSLRLEKMAAGENLNTWGDPHLNTDFDLIDFAIAGWTTVLLTGDHTLSTANYATDEARSALLKFTGTGSFTVTLPNVSKHYVIWNACTGDLTVTLGAGETVVVESSEKAGVFTDGATGVFTLGFNDQSTKKYVDATAFNYNAGNLPAQPGNAGKFITTNGTIAGWAFPSTASISDYLSDQTTRRTTATALAVAFAATL
jgi:hypothetical protein